MSVISGTLNIDIFAGKHEVRINGMHNKKDETDLFSMYKSLYNYHRLKLCCKNRIMALSTPS